MAKLFCIGVNAYKGDRLGKKEAVYPVKPVQV
jgi:hypothetical protein